MNQHHQPQDEGLDRLLNAWSNYKSPTDEEIQRNHHQIVSRLDATPDVQQGRDQRVGRLEPVRTFFSEPPAMKAALSVAAVCLLATGVWIFFFHNGDLVVKVPGSPDGSLPKNDVVAKGVPLLAGSSFPVGETPRKRALLKGLEELFSGQLCWVAESDEEVELGMHPRRTGISAGTEGSAVAVRFAVARRSPGEQQWVLVWNMDVATRSEQLIEAKLNGSTIALWVYPLPDGSLAIDSEVTVRSPVAFCSTCSSVQTGGVPELIHSAIVNDSEYALFQTVVPLEGDEIL